MTINKLWYLIQLVMNRNNVSNQAEEDETQHEQLFLPSNINNKMFEDKLSQGEGDITLRTYTFIIVDMLLNTYMRS